MPFLVLSLNPGLFLKAYKAYLSGRLPSPAASLRPPPYPVIVGRILLFPEGHTCCPLCWMALLTNFMQIAGSPFFGDMSYAYGSQKESFQISQHEPEK